MKTPLGTTVEPPTERIAAGATLYRVHPARYPAEAFHPGSGAAKPLARFSFFGQPAIVPALYAADSVEAAIGETLLRDVPLAGGSLPLENVDYRVLSQVTTTRELTLLRLHGDGFRRIGVAADQLTTTSPRRYHQTVPWGGAAYRAGLDGVAWMSRHHDSSGAYVLYRPGDVAAHPAGTVLHDFTTPDGLDWLTRQLAPVNVDIRFA